MSRFLDAGAIDVLPSPLGIDRVQGLAVHAYRTYKEVSREAASFVLQKRNRKLSWVGIDEERPYAYLREVMVSGLMNGICNPDSVGESIDPRLVLRTPHIFECFADTYVLSELRIESDRKAVVAQAVGTWEFSAHDFDSDELLYAALTMLQHVLQMPELARWRIPTGMFNRKCRSYCSLLTPYRRRSHHLPLCLQTRLQRLCSIPQLPSHR
jgi:hypothetical protein